MQTKLNISNINENQLLFGFLLNFSNPMKSNVTREQSECEKSVRQNFLNTKIWLVYDPNNSLLSIFGFVHVLAMTKKKIRDYDKFLA